MSPIRVVFFGTESFAAQILEALIADDRFIIATVVTQPPRAIGRAQTIHTSPAHDCAINHHIPLLIPEKIKTTDFLAAFESLEPDLTVVAQYGKIIPASVLAVASYGAVNVHASLLPRWRGATPVHAAIAAGDTRTGITYMLMDEQMDHGPIIATYKMDISPHRTTPQLMDELAGLAHRTCTDTLAQFCAGTLQPQEQNHCDATYTTLLTKSSGHISCTVQSAMEIERLVRALQPWPGVSITMNELQLKLCAVHVSPDHQPIPAGTLHCSGSITAVGTRDGVLIIDSLIPAGKKEMTGAAFANGYAHLNGATVNEPTDPNDVFLRSLHSPPHTDEQQATT